MDIVLKPWKLIVMLIVIHLIQQGAQGNKVCPPQTTAGYPVVQMCEQLYQADDNRVFLDVFASASKDTHCYCVLQVIGEVQFGFNQIVTPGTPCDSKLSLYSKFIPGTPRYFFSCDKNAATPSLNATTDTMMLDLESPVTTTKDSTYCLEVYKTGGSGKLGLECFGAASTTTEPSTTTTEPSTTSTEPPTPSTEPPTPSTEPPTPSTEPPTPSTEPPTPSTEPPTPSTEPPTPSTETPTPSTETPTPSPEPTTPTPEPSPTSSTHTPSTETLPYTSPSAFPIVQVIGGVAAGVVVLIIIIAIVLGRRHKEKDEYNNYQRQLDNSKTQTPDGSFYAPGYGGDVQHTQADMQYIDFPDDGEHDNTSDDINIPNPLVNPTYGMAVPVDEAPTANDLYATVNKGRPISGEETAAGVEMENPDGQKDNYITDDAVDDQLEIANAGAETLENSNAEVDHPETGNSKPTVGFAM